MIDTTTTEKRKEQWWLLYDGRAAYGVPDECTPLCIADSRDEFEWDAKDYADEDGYWYLYDVENPSSPMPKIVNERFVGSAKDTWANIAQGRG